MCVKPPFRDLNSDLFPQHLISTYTIGILRKSYNIIIQKKKKKPEEEEEERAIA